MDSPSHRQAGGDGIVTLRPADFSWKKGAFRAIAGIRKPKRPTLAGALAGVLIALAGASAQEAPPIAASSAPLRTQHALPVQPRSVVYSITDPSIIDGFQDNPESERVMVERLVLAATGQRDRKAAWSKLVQPKDVVGIKVSAAGGRFFSTHPGIVSAVVNGLELAGVPPEHIIIWDRQSQALREAGYLDRRPGPKVKAIDPPRGFDPEAIITAPTLGLLIWGDLSFRGIETGRRRMDLQASQTSAESHLARIVSKEVTKIINLPTFSDARGCAVAGALYNVTVPNLDNSRRFSQGGGASSICDIYSDPRIGAKVALTIVDGLLAQYAGGPEFNPNYAYTYRTLLASKDPVALDATMLRKLEEWRREARLPSLEKEGSWIQEAETIGLGTFDPSRITVQALPFP